MARVWRAYMAGEHEIRRLLASEAKRFGTGLLDRGAIDTIVRRRPKSLVRMRNHLPDALVEVHGQEILTCMLWGMTPAERARSWDRAALRRARVASEAPPWHRPDVEEDERLEAQARARDAAQMRVKTADTREAIERQAPSSARRLDWRAQMEAEREAYHEERARPIATFVPVVPPKPPEPDAFEVEFRKWRAHIARLNHVEDDEFLPESLVVMFMRHRPVVLDELMGKSGVTGKDVADNMQACLMAVKAMNGIRAKMQKEANP